MEKQAISLVLAKDGLDITLKLKVAPEIEEYFKTFSSGETEQSNKWHDASNAGLMFYKKTEKMSDKVSGQQVMDNFGNGLFDVDTNRINVALIRTVGASNGITIKTTGLLSYAEMEKYIRDLAIWVRKFYEDQVRPAEITAQIALNV